MSGPRDEPVPIRRAAIGCLLLAILGLGAAALVRPAIYLLAPPRDDARVIVGTLTELGSGPVVRDQILGRSYGHDGEIDAEDGRVQVRLIIAPAGFGAASVVNAASPLGKECPVEIGADRLLDCEGRAWTFQGLPIDSADPPLERFAVRIENGAIVADLTEPIDD
ncbi:MAG TPA: hypothetical protein VLA59_09155 [Patescibacteria group bacterium]|nr:hypothetical protein [Patescibacteria group bacterium]